jgi:hypothetical protein
MKQQELAFVPKKKKRGHMKELEDFDRTVRVLKSVPSNFKAPTRGMGW